MLRALLALVLSLAAFAAPAQLAVDASKTGIGRTATLLAASAVAVSHTGNTNNTTLATISIPGGAMGASGAIWVRAYFSITGSTNSKTFSFTLGGSSLNALSVSGVVATVGYGFDMVVRNRGSASSQFALKGTPGNGAAVSAAPSLSVNTAVAQDLVIAGQLGLGSETITLESYEVWLVP